MDKIGEIIIKNTNNKSKENHNKNNKIVIIFTIIVILAIIIFGLLGSKTKIMKKIYPREYENLVKIYAEKYQVDENLIYAIIKAESNFEVSANSSKGAKGLMQLMEETAKDVAKKVDINIELETIEEKLLEADTNINLGTKYISILLERYNNIALALTAYNAGIGTVDTWIEKGIIREDGEDIENIPYKETNNYVRKILRDYKIYQELYSN